MEHAWAWMGTLWRDPLYGMLLRLCVGQALVLAGVCVTVAALRYHRLRDQEATQLTASEAYAPLMSFLAEEIDELRAASVLRPLPRDKLVDLLERLTANLHGPSLERLQLLYAALRLRRDAAWLVRSWRWWRRLEGVRLYGAMGGSMSHAPLLRALRDRHPSVRMAAARALGRIQSPDVLPSLLGALGGGMFDLSRRQIAAILVSMGPTAWPILRAELDKPAYQPGQLRLHTAILEVLALSGDLQARGVILRALRDPEEELRIAGFKAAVLMHLSLPAEELRRGLGDERWTVRAQAARACGAGGAGARPGGGPLGPGVVGEVQRGAGLGDAQVGGEGRARAPGGALAGRLRARRGLAGLDRGPRLRGAALLPPRARHPPAAAAAQRPAARP